MKNSEIINELIEAGKVLSVIVSRTTKAKYGRTLQFTLPKNLLNVQTVLNQ